jgi:hypothetical protein
MRLLRWLFRPVVLVAVSAVLVAAAALTAFRPTSGSVAPQRMPVRAGDSEVAFVYPATNSAAWDRFVAAVRRTRDRLLADNPGLEVHEQSASGGAGSTATAEVSLAWPSGRRLVFRWYKLTSEWTTELWMKELVRRPPYPLAVIGGGNSNGARELALSLRDASAGLPRESRPLLLITTATADNAGVKGFENGDLNAPAEDAQPLTGLHENGKYRPGIYEGHTYRFCFRNRQMASAVSRFIWSQPDLRPDGDPVYLVQWMDDWYSRDLFNGYAQVLPRRTAEDLAGRVAFTVGVGGQGAPLAALGAWWTPFNEAEGPSYRIPTSVGSFSSPNPFEARSASLLLNHLAARPEPMSYKHLLVITGQVAPSRRFLLDLARSWPDAPRRLVVAGGDAIPFNAIYRDRTVTWQIQDLPFKFVFFCHRNPISEEAGFRPIDPRGPTADARPSCHSGTEDLLLFADIVESLALVHGKGGVPDSKALAAGLDRLHWEGGELTLQPMGRPLFSDRNKGSRNQGTGEHLVVLRPVFDGDQVLSEATIEVWYTFDVGQGTSFRRVGRPGGGVLRVSYVEREAHGDRLP